MYVIRRSGDGAYVANPGRAGSYTNSLEHARKFTTLEAARADCCGNEYAVSVDSLLGRW